MAMTNAEKQAVHREKKAQTLDLLAERVVELSRKNEELNAQLAAAIEKNNALELRLVNSAYELKIAKLSHKGAK